MLHDIEGLYQYIDTGKVDKVALCEEKGAWERQGGLLRLKGPCGGVTRR